MVHRGRSSQRCARRADDLAGGPHLRGDRHYRSPLLDRCVLFEKQGSHDQIGQERDGDRVNVLRPRHTDTEGKPDARHADRVEQLAAE